MSHRPAYPAKRGQLNARAAFPAQCIHSTCFNFFFCFADIADRLDKGSGSIVDDDMALIRLVLELPPKPNPQHLNVGRCRRCSKQQD